MSGSRSSTAARVSECGETGKWLAAGQQLVEQAAE